MALGDEFRLIFADHRGHGRSGAPHEPEAYALPTRVADHVAVLDELGLDRAHVLGFSWALASASRSANSHRSGCGRWCSAAISPTSGI